MIKHAFIFCLIHASLLCSSQVQIERQVISPLGQVGQGSIYLSSTLGQIDYTTGSSDQISLTQGFQQPSSELVVPEIFIDYPECIAGEVAAIQINIEPCPNAVVTLNSEEVLELPAAVDQGEYELIVIGDGCFVHDTITIDFTDIPPCDINFFTGFSPNGDNTNEVWIIENVVQPTTQENSVEIFSRWGDEIWNASNYDNTEVVFEGKTNDGIEVPAGTYFFIFKSDSFEHHGYFELIR